MKQSIGPSPANKFVFFFFFFIIFIVFKSFANWGIDPKINSSLHLPPTSFYQKFTRKKEIVVAIVDTGIDFHHPLLKGALYLPPSEGNITFKNYGLDFSKPEASSKTPIDNNGHGTHIAGIIHTIDPQAKLLIIKYYSPLANKKSNLEAIAHSLQYAIQHKVDIINYSSVGDNPSNEEFQLLKEAENKGIIVVSASGNQGRNIDPPHMPSYPARYNLNNLFIALAHDQFSSPYKNANWGKKNVLISAPGVDIASTIPFSRIGIKSGTSQSAAFLSGAISLIKAYKPHLSVVQTKEFLLKSCDKLKAFEDSVQCEGMLNLLKALSNETITTQK